MSLQSWSKKIVKRFLTWGTGWLRELHWWLELICHVEPRTICQIRQSVDVGRLAVISRLLKSMSVDLQGSAGKQIVARKTAFEFAGKRWSTIKQEAASFLEMQGGCQVLFWSIPIILVLGMFYRDKRKKTLEKIKRNPDLPLNRRLPRYKNRFDSKTASNIRKNQTRFRSEKGLHLLSIHLPWLWSAGSSQNCPSSACLHSDHWSLASISLLDLSKASFSNPWAAEQSWDLPHARGGPCDLRLFQHCLR